ncbi:MAG: hypothetical protein OHK005_17400 [Candidatus Methylacidiphilales bacterium]
MNPFCAFLALWLPALGLVQAQGITPRPADEDSKPDAAAASTPTRSRVAVVEDPSLVFRFQADPDRAAKAFNRALLALTGRNSIRDAWLSLIRPTDRIGIKISTGGHGSYGSTPAILGAILEGLHRAGVPMDRVILWDRPPASMSAAGFAPGTGPGGWRILSVFPGVGYDPEKFYFNEVVGQLIWGDYEFKGRGLDVAAMLDVADPKGAADRAGPRREGQLNSQISNRSYFTRILTRETDKIINVAAMTDHPDVGLYGCLASLALSSIDNYRRFLGRGIAGDPAIAEIWEHDALRGKVVLNVMDGLVAQFAGGPNFTPNYAQAAGLIFLSRDPVAIDALALARIEQWRADRKVVPVGDLARHISGAASVGLGLADPTKLDLIRVP